MDQERNWGTRDQARIRNFVELLRQGTPHHTLDTQEGRSAARYKLGLCRHEVTGEWREQGPHPLIREFDLSQPTRVVIVEELPVVDDEPAEEEQPAAEDDQPSPFSGEEPVVVPAAADPHPVYQRRPLPPPPPPPAVGGVQLRPAPPAFPPPGLPHQAGAGYWQDRRREESPPRRVRARGGRGGYQQEDRIPSAPVARRPRSFSVRSRRVEEEAAASPRGGYPRAGSGAASSSSGARPPVLQSRAESLEETQRAAAASTRRRERPADTRGSVRSAVVPEVAGVFRLPPPLSLEDVEDGELRAAAVGSSFLIALDVHGCLDSLPTIADTRAGAHLQSTACWYQKIEGDWDSVQLPNANIRAVRSVHFARELPVPVCLLSYVGDPRYARSAAQADRSENHARSVFALRRTLATELGLCTRQERLERSIADHWQSFEGPGGDRLFARVIHQRCGPAGKAREARLNGVPVIIDDRDDIVWEADSLGILAYQVGNVGVNAYTLERVADYLQGSEPPCLAADHLIHSHASFVQALAHCYDDIKTGRAQAKLQALRRFHHITPATPPFPWGTLGAPWQVIAPPADTQLAIQGTRARRRR